MRSVTGFDADASGGRGMPKVALKERLVGEFGPLFSFFITTQLAGIAVGTGVFMLATVLAVAAGIWRERRVPLTPMLSAVMIVGFGGLSLVTAEPWLIMIRPTLMNLFYAIVLLAGLALGKHVLARVLSGSLALDSGQAWTVLTLRASAFLVLLAVLNEITWRYYPLEVWVAFKTFAVIPMNILFIAAQAPYVRRHRLDPQPVRAGSRRAPPSERGPHRENP